MNLYEIDKSILELADPETGEITDWAKLEELQMEREKKLENVALWCKDLKAQAAAIREEEAALANRRKVIEVMIESRERYLEGALQGRKFETARCFVSFRRSQRVEITDERAAVNWARENERHDLIAYTLPAIKKGDLGPLLKAGEIIPGAKLTEKVNVLVK